MFLSHFAVALASKKAAPKVSLGTLIIAAQFLDLLWPALVLLGVEHVRIAPGDTATTPLDFYDYPISHSLLTVCIYAVLLGGVVLWRKKGMTGAIVVALGVVSHWVLDVISHRPDMPLAPGASPLLGLGLWNSVPATVIVEFGLFALGVVIYLRAAKPVTRGRRIGFWILIAFLAVIYLSNIFGPPPPSVSMIAYAGLLLWIFPFWGWSVDRR